MNSQVMDLVDGPNDVSRLRHVSSSALNNTFHISGEGYFHFSTQPPLGTAEESLLLDRYIYENKGEKIARRALNAASVAQNMTSDRIVIPQVIQYGSLNSPENGELLAYWVDNEVEGVNAKLEKDVLSSKEYMALIDWIIAVQTELVEAAPSVAQDYLARSNAFRSLIDAGYYGNVVPHGDFSALHRIADSMAQWSETSLLNQQPVFKHGDLHIANILKMKNDAVAIVDFEASMGGPGDNLKDIMKLLHLDYAFFDIQQSKEGAFLTDTERLQLLDYYVSNSKIDEVGKLRESAYLLKRIALDSLNRYTTRLTLASRQGSSVTDMRIQKIMHDIAAIMARMEA